MSKLCSSWALYAAVSESQENLGDAVVHNELSKPFPE